MQDKCDKHQAFVVYTKDLLTCLAQETELTLLQKHALAHKEIYRTTHSVFLKKNKNNSYLECEKKCCQKKHCPSIYRLSCTNYTCALRADWSKDELHMNLDEIYEAIDKNITQRVREQLTQRTNLRKLDTNNLSNVLYKNEWVLTRLIKVIDGDTISVGVLTGNTALKVSVRVFGIDAPETRRAGEKEMLAGKLVGNYVKSLLGDIVKVKFTGVDKWGGRWLGYVQTSNDVCLSKHLLEKGYAKSYLGEKKECWSNQELEKIIKALQ